MSSFEDGVSAHLNHMLAAIDACRVDIAPAEIVDETDAIQRLGDSHRELQGLRETLPAEDYYRMQKAAEQILNLTPISENGRNLLNG